MKRIFVITAALTLITLTAAYAAGGGREPSVEDAPFNVEDPWLIRLQGLSYNKKPKRPVTPGRHDRQ